MDISKWTVDEVKQALNRGGYIADDIFSAEFKSVTATGKAVFAVQYHDMDFGNEDDVGEGYVYIGFNSNGILVGDY